MRASFFIELALKSSHSQDVVKEGADLMIILRRTRRGGVRRVKQGNN